MRIVLAALIVALLSPLVTPAQSQSQAPAAAPAPAPSQNATPAPPQTATPAAVKPEAAAPCPPVDNQGADTMPRKYVEVWNTGNFDYVECLFTPPTIIVSRGGRVVLQPQTLKKVVAAWRKSMPDLQFKIEDTIIQGDKVAMRLSFKGSYKERLFGDTAKPSPDLPRTVRSTEMLMFLLKDGKIKEIWEEYDEIRMRLEMGGFWRTNQELEAMAARDAQAARTAPTGAPAATEAAPAPAPPKP
jgi:predicted ester cyclase